MQTDMIALPADKLRRSTCRLLQLSIIGALAAGAFLVEGYMSPAPASDSVLEEVKARGTLRIAGAVYRPFLSRKPDGSYVGIDVDVLEMIAKDLDVKLEFVDAGWDTVVAGITTKKWDIIPATCITPQRLEVIDFSESYIMLGGVLTVRADNDRIQKLEDADDPSIVFATLTGGWSEQIAQAAFPKATKKGFGQATDADMVQEVLSGRADAVVIDAPVTTMLVLEQIGEGRLKFFPSVTQPMDILPCPVGYGIVKGDVQWKSYLDEFLSGKKASGELNELFKKWLKAEHIQPD